MPLKKAKGKGGAKVMPYIKNNMSKPKTKSGKARGGKK